ncbi:MAG: CPCC family cysteine-rich protein [Pseudomonadota bacterium]
MQDKFPCPCCGHLVFDREPGYHQTCPICLWEDELAQLRFPAMPGISNSVSLVDAQINYQRIGVAERKNMGQGRAAIAGEALEEGWRPIDPSIDNLEQPTSGEDYSTSYPWSNTTVLYYWRPTYWRRVVG